MIRRVNKKHKFCAVCKNWNGGRGADYIVPFSLYFVDINSEEEHKCMINGVNRKATYGCGCKFYENKF